MSLQSDLDDKHTKALLNGLVKIEFLNDSSVAEQIEELFTDSKMSPESKLHE